MSSNKPNRPGAPARRPSGPPAAGASISNNLTIEQMLNLPDSVDEGEAIDLDPSNADAGGFGTGQGESATIVAARFGKFAYPNRTDIAPELRIFLSFQRDGMDTPYETSLKYVTGKTYAQLAATADGNFVKPRPGVVTEKRPVPPAPYKYAQGVLFLQSIKDKGFSAERLNKEGLKALVGLRVHVSKRKVEGQNENAKAALLVDFIEGDAGSFSSGSTGAQTGTPATTATNAPAAAQAAAPAVAQTANPIPARAEQALVEILSAAGGSISRSEVATALIKMDEWKKEENKEARKLVLQQLRDDNWISSSALWSFDAAANTISLS